MKDSHKIKIYSFIGFILSIVIFTSCEDFFDVKPSNRITPDDHYNSYIDAEISQIGVFSLLQEVAPKLIIVNGVNIYEIQY